MGVEGTIDRASVGGVQPGYLPGSYCHAEGKVSKMGYSWARGRYRAEGSRKGGAAVAASDLRQQIGWKFWVSYGVTDGLVDYGVAMAGCGENVLYSKMRWSVGWCLGG